jgi:hypothetical protein
MGENQNMGLRIKFLTEEDCIRGNFVLIRNTLSRRLRGDIVEIADRDRKLLDDNGLHYTILPIPGPDGPDPAFRIPPTFEVQQRNGD